MGERPLGYALPMRSPRLAVVSLLLASACSLFEGTAPPAQGWDNRAPTVVQQVVDRDDAQVLEVQAGAERRWVAVPDIGAEVGEYVLLGPGTTRADVDIPELGLRAPELVDIPHARVVDQETAERTIASDKPADAVPVATVYAELEPRADQEIVVFGTVARVATAVGSVWVHVQDGTGDPARGTHDLTIQTTEPPTRGQRVAYRGVLRRNVDLGFGYH